MRRPVTSAIVPTGFRNKETGRCRGAAKAAERLVVSRTMAVLRGDSMVRFLRVNRDLHCNRVITRFNLEWCVDDGSPVSMIRFEGTRPWIRERETLCLAR